MKKVIVMLLLVLIFMSGCGEKVPEGLTDSPYTETKFMVGTVVTLKVYDVGKEDVLEVAFDEIESLGALLTMHEAGSETEEINKHAGSKPVKVSDHTYQLIDIAIQHAKLSNGMFDISIGPLTSLWNIGFPDARKPEQSEIDAVLPLINYELIELNPDQQTVFLKEKGMKIDLGGIAKGYIADEVVKIFKEHGVTTAVIDLGGNVIVMGKNIKDKPWTVGVQNPFLSRGESIGSIQVVDKSIVTSGIYERVLEVDNDQYHHLLSPKDGYPFMNGLAGVSIISDLSVDGDALSTAAFAKGVQEGLKLIEEYENADAIFVDINKKVYTTSGLKGKFKLTNENYELIESSSN